MESLEDFLTRSTEILRAHKDELWAQKNELFAGCSESIRSHREGLRKSREELLAGCLESIRAQRDGLLQTRDSLKMRSSELFASVSETLIAEGLFLQFISQFISLVLILQKVCSHSSFLSSFLLYLLQKVCSYSSFLFHEKSGIHILSRI